MKENKKKTYKAEVGDVSKSGRTVLRITKDGRKYWFNPDSYKLQKERLLRKRADEDGYATREWIKQRVVPLCHAPKSESYMKYFQRKSEIRSEYPKWLSMNKEQHREYFRRVLDLMQTDKDLRYYLEVECETIQEKWKREKLERENEADYDGHGEEYKW